MSSVDKIKEIEAEVNYNYAALFINGFLDGSYAKEQEYRLSFGYFEGQIGETSS